MADIRKEQEREELHKAIWSIADDLRGSVDGWDFKQYVLGMMFYRYISENLTNYIGSTEKLEITRKQEKNKVYKRFSCIYNTPKYGISVKNHTFWGR